MGATSSLCSGSKSVQVVNSTGRRPDRQPDGQTALNNARAPGVNQGSGLRLNNHGPALTESETKWIQQTNNNATRNKTNPSKRNDIAASGNNGAAETTDVVDRRQAANRRKEEGCNLSVYDNLPGSLGKLAVWGDNLDIEGSSSRYSAYKSSDGFGVDEYVDGYLVNQHTDLNHSDTSLLGSDSGDSWQLGGKILGNQQRGSSSSSQTSLRNPSLDNGNRSEVTSKHSSTSNNSSRLYRPGNKDFLSKGDYDNLPPLRSAVPDSDNLSVIGEVREADMKCASSNVQPDLFRPSRVSSAKCERVSNKENVSTLRQAKSLTLPLTPRSRPKSARKRDVSAKRTSERTDNGFSEGSASESGEDEVLSIPDETRGAGDHSDDLSDGLSGLGSTPDLALEALDSFPDSLAPTPLVSKEPTRQQRPPSFDIKSVLDDKGPPIGKKGSERSISGIVITQTDEGNTETNPRLKTLPPNTTLEEVGAMIAGDIIYRRSQGSMTQAEYRNIVKAYRIILEQLLAYQDENGKNKTPLTVKDKTNKTKQLESEKNSAPANETQVEKDSPQYLRQEKQEKAASNTNVDGSPDTESPSSSDLDEKLDQVTSVFEEEFVQKLVERGSGLTEADITQYLTEHAQNVKGIKNVLETQKVKEVLSGNPEEMAALGPLQQRRLAMLDEVARLLYLFSADMATKDGTDLDELCEAILESLAPTPAEEPQPETVEEEGALFGAKVEQAMIELNDSFMRTVAYKRNEATAEELSHIIEQHLIEETATVKRHELERLRTINNNLALLGKTSTGFHVKVPELDSRLDDMNKKRRKLEQALKRILLGRKPIGGEEISDILEKYRKEQRGVIEDRDVQRLKRRDDLKKKLVTKPEKKQPVKKKDILNEMKKRYEMKAKSVKQDKASAAFHALAAQKIVDSGSLSKESLTGLIKEHQRRVAELENVRRREQQRQIDANLRAVAQDKAEDERRNKERRVFLNRATDVKMRAEDVLASYRDATLQLHSLRPVHLPKSPRHLEENVPDSGYMDGTSADSTSVTPSVVTATPSIATATPISSPGPEYSHHYSNRLTPKRADDAESVRVEDYETFELLVNDVIDQCVDDYSRAENLYSWLVSQEVPSGHEGSHDGESPLFALSCIAKGLRTYADVFLEMTKLAGLNCEKVEGYTKTPAYSPGEDIFCDLYRHTWNAVYIDNRYFLLDASEGSRREKFFREHFFCTGPSIFALTHFPDNQRWQLMERLVTKEDFAFALKVWPAMFVYDIRPLNSRSLIRTYDGKMCITFSVKNHSVLCHLEYAGPGRAVDPRELGYHVDQHTNNVDHEESFHLTLPQEGVYFFTLLVNDPEDEFDLPVCQYRIDYQDELL